MNGFTTKNGVHVTRSVLTRMGQYAKREIQWPAVTIVELEDSLINKIDNKIYFMLCFNLNRT